MQKLLHHCGVYRVGRVDEVLIAARDSGLAVARIASADKAGLLREIALALEFPDWFGQNWDALEDCLTDLSWREAPGHVLLFENPKPGYDLGVLIDVLRSAAAHWAGRGKPFLALFVDPAGRLSLPQHPRLA